MADASDTVELVAECKRLKEWLLLSAGDEVREACRIIFERYCALAQAEQRIEQPACDETG
jgi:hypothetical protein